MTPQAHNTPLAHIFFGLEGHSVVTRLLAIGFSCFNIPLGVVLFGCGTPLHVGSHALPELEDFAAGVARVCLACVAAKVLVELVFSDVSLGAHIAPEHFS